MAATAYGTDTGYQAGAGKHGGGTVTAVIHNAVDLPDKDWFGKQDPYCIFDVGDQRFETPAVKSGGENPYWDEQFSFNPSGLSSIKVTLYNKNRLRPDNIIGSGIISLGSVNEGGITSVPIQDKKGNPAGVLRMSFRGMGGSGTRGTGEGVYEQGVAEEGYTGAATNITSQQHHHHAGGVTGVASDIGVSEGLRSEGVRSEGFAQRTSEAVCGQEYFTRVEDRPRVVERTEYIREHHPVEKQYVTETKFIGEQETGSRTVESLGVREEVVGEPMITNVGTTTRGTTGCDTCP